MNKSTAFILALGLFVLGLILGSYGSRFVNLPFEGMFSKASMSNGGCSELDWDCRSCVSSGGVWWPKQRTCSMTVKPAPARTEDLKN